MLDAKVRFFIFLINYQNTKHVMKLYRNDSEEKAGVHTILMLIDPLGLHVKQQRKGHKACIGYRCDKQRIEATAT